MSFHFFQWLYDEAASIRDAINRLEHHNGLAPSPAVPKSPEVLRALGQPVPEPAAPSAPSPEPAPAAVVTTSAGTTVIPAGPDYSRFPTAHDALTWYGTLGLPQSWDWNAWWKAHPDQPSPFDVAAPIVLKPGDPGYSPNSDNALASFEQLYAKGRWIMHAGVPITVPIVAPSAGDFHIAASGTGGAPDVNHVLPVNYSVNPTLSYADANGAPATKQAPASNYPYFTATAAGERFTLNAVVSQDSVQDLTLQPGQS